MAEAGNYWNITARNLNPIPSPLKAEPKFLKVIMPNRTTTACLRRNEFSPKKTRKNQRTTPRRLITISTSSDGKWKDEWTCDYIFSLQQLQLEDLAEEEEEVEEEQGQRDRTPVSISLSIQKHASFGLSVDGRIKTSFTSKCVICSSPYCRRIDTKFNVWVLASGRRGRPTQLPEIGADDPSVIYVKPGREAELDSVIQETIRLATSLNETCSESCDKSEPRMQYIGEQKAPSTDRRWSKLLQLKNASR